MQCSARGLRIRMIASTSIMLLTLGSVAPAGDSFLHGSRVLTDIDERATERNPDGHSNARIREGTLIPPTSGRIVMIGRRWAFIPADHQVTHPNSSLGQLLISENLMLQRIVEAIREDAADDRWTVSGEVSEFFDRNRLIIRTAQRAAAN